MFNRPAKLIALITGPILTAAALLLAAGLIFAAAGLSLQGCARKEPPTLVLIVIDTLRADFLGCYGYAKETSPRIDALARRGTLFNAAVAASPWTAPSVCSITTGMYPDEVGVRDLQDGLTESVTTLAERLKQGGYVTGAVVSNSLAGPVYGHDQGYDFFQCRSYKKKKEGGGKGVAGLEFFTADLVTDEALAWLDSTAATKGPRFLNVHYTDPHDPYLPPEAWRDKFLGGAQPPEAARMLSPDWLVAGAPDHEVARVRACYEGEIAFTDAEIGRLLDGLPAETVVVLTGDHGEGFLEHKLHGHGNSLFQELLGVPLIVAGPGVPDGRTVDAPVSHVDITPTLLDLAGELAKVRDDLSGQSLLPLLEGTLDTPPAQADPRKLFSILESRKTRRVAIREGAWKFEISPTAHNVSLYDLATDPDERNDISMDHPKMVSGFIDAMKARKGRLKASPTSRNQAVDREREEELRALGYIK